MTILIFSINPFRNVSQKFEFYVVYDLNTNLVNGSVGFCLVGCFVGVFLFVLFVGCFFVVFVFSLV